MLPWAKKVKRHIKHIRRQPVLFCVTLVILAASVVAGFGVRTANKRLAVDEASYQPLLRVIANAESNGNDNAYFGNANNTTINFTKMSVADVLQWQKKYVGHGSPSSAVGRYQFLNTTLYGLVKSQSISPSQQFDGALQDKLAVVLLNRRGGEAYVNGELSREQFAVNIAKEWASLPKMTGSNPSASYYAGDGLNKALVNPETVLQAIEQIRAK